MKSLNIDMNVSVESNNSDINRDNINHNNVNISDNDVVNNATAEATMKMFNYLTDFCSTIPLSIALINIPINLTVMLIIGVQRRQTSGRTHPGQIHLLFLAISDILVGMAFVAGAVWLLFLPTDWRLIENQLKFQLRFRILFSYIVFSAAINRFLTLYITIKRTQCVLNINAAEKMRAQSTKDIVFHVIMYGVMPGIIFFMTIKLIPDILVDTKVITPHTNELYFWGYSVIFFFLIALAMTIMGTTIVTKIKARRFHENHRHTFKVVRYIPSRLEMTGASLIESQMKQGE